MSNINTHNINLNTKKGTDKKTWLQPDIDVLSTGIIESGHIHLREAIYNHPGSTAAYNTFVS